MVYKVIRNTNPDELYHYGVLGMKWGVHRGRINDTISKAQRKMEKLDAKSQKALRKKYKRSNPIIRTSYSDARYATAARKSDKALAKANKWYNSVEKVLGSTVASELKNADGTSAGERYVTKLLG